MAISSTSFLSRCCNDINTTLMSSTSFCISSTDGDGLMEVEKEATTTASRQGDTKHKAAVKLQKVYKSFRTRRKLADCAVIVEQSWWKLLDFAELKHSSVSFFGVGKQESAISRWSRARTRAAKVGKGLSKNDGAQKLALQHWLEAIDPRHRYGHNLQFYYDKWLHCQSREPFFYWLDIGEGKEVSLVEKCPRSKLQLQCIKYLGPTERKEYEVDVVGGRLVYKNTEEIVDTRGESKDVKWIFVLSASKALYVGKKVKGMFQHSSFMAGGATSAAGRLVVENGVLKAVWPHSGHYRPTKENFHDFISFLEEKSVDLSDVKLTPNEEDDEISSCPSGFFSGVGSFKEEEGDCLACCDEKTEEEEEEGENLQCSEQWKKEGVRIESRKEEEEEEEEYSEKRYKGIGKVGRRRLERWGSYQVGVKGRRVWTSGVGARISWVREYPWEIQTRALEEVNLSPRNSGGGERLNVLGWGGKGEERGWSRVYPSEPQMRLLEQVNLSPRSALPCGGGRWLWPRHRKLTVFGEQHSLGVGIAVENVSG